MRGADAVNDAFEVGFDQHFESRWYRAELIKQVLMLGILLCAGAGLLGRGPCGRRTIRSANGDIWVHYEPVSWHGSATMVTVQVRNARDTEQPVTRMLDRHIVEPMKFQHAVPRPDSASVADSSIRLTFLVGAFSGTCMIGPMRLDQVRYPVAERDRKTSIVETEA